MHTQRRDDSPIHRRGGQESFLLLGKDQFGSENLAVTWVDCPPGSEQQLHQHETQEQMYVIVRGRGVMVVGHETQEVSEGTIVYIPPRSPHAIRNTSDELMSYVSATSPPFDDASLGTLYKPR